MGNRIPKWKSINNPLINVFPLKDLNAFIGKETERDIQMEEKWIMHKKMSENWISVRFRDG